MSRCMSVRRRERVRREVVGWERRGAEMPAKNDTMEDDGVSGVDGLST